jgi:hypothetical protein
MEMLLQAGATGSYRVATDAVLGLRPFFPGRHYVRFLQDRKMMRNGRLAQLQFIHQSVDRQLLFRVKDRDDFLPDRMADRPEKYRKCVHIIISIYFDYIISSKSVKHAFQPAAPASLFFPYYM